MRILFFGIIGFFMVLICSCTQEEDGKHLFILSGQSNMVGLIPEESFKPALDSEFGAEHVLIVKNAYGGQPIRRWYRDWQAPPGDCTPAAPDLYDSLMVKLQSAIADQSIQTVTFLWMQGERDAREKLGEVYERSLLGLYDQLANDLQRSDMHFVIGRLSDFDLSNRRYPHWTLVREAQMQVGESNPRFAWIDTDDLNDGLARNGTQISDDLHMSAEGYVIMGQRFAEKAIELINNN